MTPETEARPRISVVIPAYRASGTLPLLVRSLGHQTRLPDEIILVDDCSGDGTQALARSLGLVVLEQGRTMGPGAARNRGIRESHGDVIAFVDSDCVCEPDWLEKIEKHFRDSGKAVLTGRVLFEPASLFERAVCDLGWPAGGTAGFEAMWKVFPDGRAGHLCSSNFAARRFVFERAGFFNETIPYPVGEDNELAARWIASGVKICFCPELNVRHRVPGSLREFICRNFKRGRGNVYCAKIMGRKKTLKMAAGRIRTHLGIIFRSFQSGRVFLTVPLAALMYASFLAGYLWQTIRR